MNKSHDAIGTTYPRSAADTLVAADDLQNAPGAGTAERPVANELDPHKLRTLLSLSTPRTRKDYEILAHLSASLSAHEQAAKKNWHDDDTAELNALLAEYATLRQESMNTINNRIQILVGLAAIAALAAACLTSEQLDSNRYLAPGVFSGAIPLVCVFIFLVWMSEAIRSHRVGYYLASAVEARINAKLGRLVVTWEAALWTGILPRDELWGPSMMALALVGLLAAAAPWFGVFVTDNRNNITWAAAVRAVGAVWVLCTDGVVRPRLHVATEEYPDCDLNDACPGRSHFRSRKSRHNVTLTKKRLTARSRSDADKRRAAQRER